MRLRKRELHGASKGKMYQLWAGMIGRCEPNAPWKHRYHQRGIFVCEGWRLSFSKWLADMGERPSDEHSIDRVDNDAGYWCGNCAQCLRDGLKRNCVWSTRLEQAANTRKAKLLTVRGETRTLRQWGNMVGVCHKTIAERVRSGMSAEDAVLTPSIRSLGAMPLRNATLISKRRRVSTDGSIEKFCKGCSRWVPIADCSKSPGCQDGRAPRCKECDKVRHELTKMRREERKSA